MNEIIKRALFFALAAAAGCASPASVQNNVAPTNPQAQEDPFLKDPAGPMNETYRILILGDSYTVRQIKGAEDLKRKEDPSGDAEQLDRFKELAARYDFKDWEFNGVLMVRLHPHRGEIEHIEFVPGQNPKTWQASKLFQEDLSRFAFTFPKGLVTLREFHVRYRWKIKRRAGLSDEEARTRAIEFLKAERQGQ